VFYFGGMDLPVYPFVFDNLYQHYRFVSVGVNGCVQKAVHFKQVKDYIFNLVFGDWGKYARRIDDRSITNNGDTNVILATVAHVVIDFIDLHPGAVIFAKGSTKSRTRLYQMGISNNLAVISQYLYIEGFLNGKWEPFEGGKNYEAFWVKAK
jgi:hypothetical protein